MNYLNRALHYCALFLLVACGAFPQNLFAQDPKRPRIWYTQSPDEPGGALINYMGKLETTHINLTLVPGGDMQNGTYSIRAFKNGAPYGILQEVSGASASFTVTNGVISKTSFVLKAVAPNTGAGYPIQTEDTGQTLTLYARPDAGYRADYHHKDWGPAFRRKVGQRDEPPPAANTTYLYDNITLSVGTAVPECPPREDLMFTMDGTLGGSGAYAIELKIDGETVFGISGTYDGFGGPPLQLNETAGPFNTATGNFTWAWVCNGQTVAGGTVGCADEILNNTIHASFDFLLTKEEIPKDPQDVPDPEKEQPPPSNTNPNPDGATPGTAPPVIKPPGPGLPVGDPGHDMYRAFVAGLGTMNEGTFPGAPYTSGLADYESEMQKRGRLDEIEGKLTEIAGQQGSIKDGLMSLNTAGDAMEDLLPSNIGKLNEWDWATFTLPTGQIVTIKLDMSTFLPMINQLRQILLLFVYIWFVWACGKEIVNAL